MSKLRMKIKGQTKEKRRPKEQRFSLNPGRKKHRNLAKSHFFQMNSNETSDTADSDMDDVSSIETFSSYKTIGSFASEWSILSNMSYSGFLRMFRANSALHNEMLAILAGITQDIKENGGSETATEYYYTLLTALKKIYEAEERDDYQLSAVLSLLSIGIKTVPKAVLRRTYSDITAKMIHILDEYASTDNNVMITAVFEILAHLLRTQELIAWNNDSTNQIFKALLNPFCIHPKSKWRKSAQQTVVSIVKSAYLNISRSNFAAEKVAVFCEETLDACLGANDCNGLLLSVQEGQTTILQILRLMKDTISYFTKLHMKRCCERILRLIMLNYPIITSCGLQVLHALFSTQNAVISAKLNVKLISALYDYQPGATNVQPTLAWLSVMEQAHIHLSDVDLAISSVVLPKIFTQISQMWVSEKSKIMTAATRALENLLKNALAPACASPELVQKYHSTLRKCFQTIEAGLHYQYHRVWHQVLHLIGVMFEVGGPNCTHMLLNCLKTLSELRDSYKFNYNNELEHAVGAAIRSMGPETVLNVISLKNQNGELNLNRSWILPVLKENIKSSTIEFFMKGILPLALYCQLRSTELAAKNDDIGAQNHELLHTQLWNLLPCFCTQPTDIKDSFQSIAKVLGTAISDCKERRLSVMASLRKLISHCKESGNEADLVEIARFDKKYLPILFNFYSTKPMGSDEEGQRLAALDTIKLYLSIAKPELTQQLLTHAIERLKSSSENPEDSFIKESILDLIRSLVPYQNADNLQLLYTQCIKPLPTLTNNKEQKKAYRLLEEICGSTSQNCKDFIKNNQKEIQELLGKSLQTAVAFSKESRLQCLNYLIKTQPKLDSESKLLKHVISEAVLSCKNPNEKTRYIAFELLNTIGEIFEAHNQLKTFTMLLFSGLGENVQLISCTMLSLASILHHFSGSLGKSNIQWILEQVCELLSSSTRVIAGSCISFINVYCKTLPSPLVAASLPLIVKSMCAMSEDCSRHFRLKVRNLLNKLVRKCGHEALTPHIPVNNTVMYKHLRNIRKLNAGKQKQNMDENEDNDEEFFVKTQSNNVDDILADSDSDLDDFATENQKSKMVKKTKQSTKIEEDPDTIVDFIDPNLINKITSTKPEMAASTSGKQVKKDHGFNSAADDRLIMKDDSSHSETKTRKKKLNFDSRDSGSETKSIVKRKRKRKRRRDNTISCQPPT